MVNEVWVVASFLIGFLLGVLQKISYQQNDCKHEFGSWEGEWSMQKRKCKNCGLIEERYIKSVNRKPWRKK